MSRFNVVIATPSTGECKFPYALALARMVAYFSQVRVFPEVAEQALDIIGVEGSGVSAGREDLVRIALGKENMTHLLFIDQDMSFGVDCLHSLARRRQSIVGCNYRMRVPPADFTAIRIDKGGRMQTTKDSTGLEEAFYMGFGFCLLSREALLAVSEPRFMIEYQPESGGYTTEDNPFFVKARAAGHRCYVDQDASRGIWHVGTMNYRYDRDYSSLAEPQATATATVKPIRSVANG